MFIDQINCHVSKLGKYISNVQGIALHTVMLTLQLKLFNFSFYEVQYWTSVMDHFTFLYLHPTIYVKLINCNLSTHRILTMRDWNYKITHNHY
jgi:hypothetical protein